jgi:hypothetical protein
MRLPLKFLPRQSQQLVDVIGAAVILVFGLSLVIDYLPTGSPAAGRNFVDWLGGAGALPFLAISILCFLFALAWSAVALVNLFGGSPFEHLIVDRFGLTHRTFWREKRYSWKELEPIGALEIGLLRARSTQRRHWIVEQGTRGGLRIAAADYLGSFWRGGLGLATGEAANWLENLRQLARADQLDPDDIPPPPAAFRPPIEIVYAGEDDDVPREDPVAAALRARPGPTIER